MPKQTCWLGLIFLLLGGCAWIDQRAVITPQLDISPSTIGAGKPVAVKIVDERPREVIGHRAASGVGGEIRAAQDIPDLVHQKVNEGLTHHGFVPGGADASSSRAMRVDLRLLEYEVTMGFWTGTMSSRAALKVTCTNGTETFDKLYRSNHEEHSMWVQTAASNNRQLSLAVSDVLDQMFRDQELLAFLAR